MFTEIAAEQPDLQLPTEDQIGTAYAGLRGPRPGAWASRATSASGCRRCGWPKGTAPSRRSTCTASTSPPRCCGCCGSARRTPPNCPIVWGNLVAGPKDPTFKLGGLEDRRGGVGADAGPLAELRRLRPSRTGLPGEPEWLPYHEADRACLLIDRRGRGRQRHRPAHPGHLGQSGAQLPVAGRAIAKLARGGVAVDWAKAWSARAAAADARSRDVRRPVLPAAADHRVGRGAQARPRRGASAHPSGCLPEARRVGQHLDGPGVRRHQRGAERDRAARLRRALRLRRAVAPARQRRGTRG